MFEVGFDDFVMGEPLFVGVVVLGEVDCFRGVVIGVCPISG